MFRPGVVVLGVVATVAAIAWVARGTACPTAHPRESRPAPDRPQLQPAVAGLDTPASPESRPLAAPAEGAPKSELASHPAVPPASPPARHDYLADRAPDEIRPDGTHVYHNYPFQMKQPDGSFATIPVTVCFTPVPAAPVVPPEAEGEPRR
jgi:hypothetical protein